MGSTISSPSVRQHKKYFEDAIRRAVSACALKLQEDLEPYDIRVDHKVWISQAKEKLQAKIIIKTGPEAVSPEGHDDFEVNNDIKDEGNVA